jgi:methionine biosynthesis protein MetW
MSYLGRLFEASEIENQRAILRAIAERGPFPRILDLGCYDGVFTQEVARAAQAQQVHGIELLEEHAAKARARGVTVTQADLEQPLPLPDGSFDLVHANQLIEHLKHTDTLLREARRLCAPGGLVVISTNNFSSWHNIATLVLGWQPMPNHVSDEIHVGNPVNLRAGEKHQDIGQTHLRIFTGRALRELAEFHGMRTESVDVSGYYPLPPAIARQVVKVDPLHSAFLIGLFRLPDRRVDGASSPNGHVGAMSTGVLGG